MSSYKGLSLDGKRVLVFGGATGLGRSMALGMAEAGADVVPVSRRAEEVKKAAAAIRALGRRSLELTADVTRREEIQRVIDGMLAEFGRIDVLVNSAGTVRRKPAIDATDEEWDVVMDTNLKGTWRTCQMVGRVMKEQSYGRIINIASVAAFQTLYGAVGYSASKAGVVMLTRCLAAEWAPYHITVNAIAPGVFETDMNRDAIQQPGRMTSFMAHTPMRRIGEYEEIKGAAIYLASDSASYVTGEVLCVDGGFLVQGIGANA